MYMTATLAIGAHRSTVHSVHSQCVRMQASRQPVVQQHESGRYSWLNPALTERPDHVSQCEMLGWILAEAVVNRTVPHIVFPPMLFSAVLARCTGREVYVPTLEEIEQFDPTLAKVSTAPRAAMADFVVPNAAAGRRSLPGRCISRRQSSARQPERS